MGLKTKNIQSNPNGSTPVDYDEREYLIPKHITTSSELNDAEFANIVEAKKKYFFSKNIFEFSYEFLFRVHKDMFGKVWRWAGKKRDTNKNIGVNKAYIDSQLKVLIDDYKFWMDHEYDHLEISCWIHHRLVHIHPFHNGNGRWARLISNIFLKQVMNSYIDWPEIDLRTTSGVKAKYIQSIIEADNLNYTSLQELHLKYLKQYSS